MKVCVLASGSKGNSTYIETENHKILLDLGRNKKYIVESLKKIGVNPKDIDIVLISHTHDDHISALETFIRAYKPIVCMPEEMIKSLEFLTDYDNIDIINTEKVYDEVTIIAIKSSHDAIDSRNYIIEENDHSVVQITDTGYIKSKYFNMLKNKDIYLMESNHDVEMLTHGPYPEWLKRRVLSDSGHLSNQASGFYLAKLIGDNTKSVYLMHLSEINNKPDIALKTVKDTLNEYDIKFDNIKCAMQEEISEVVSL